MFSRNLLSTTAHNIHDLRCFWWKVLKHVLDISIELFRIFFGIARQAPLDVPRQIKFFELATNMSTTSVPIL